MGAHSHAATQERIERLFTRGLSHAVRAELIREVEGCETCGAYYRRLHVLEAALTGSAAGLSHFARERVRDAVLDAVAPEKQTRKSLLGLKWALVGTAAAVSAVLALTLLQPTRERSHRTTLSESARLAPIELVAAKGHPKKETADVGIRLFKVSKAGDAVTEDSSLLLNDIITFTYTYAKSHDGYLALFGIQETGEVRWYYPDYGENKTFKIQGNRVDEPLEDGIDLSINHEPGWLRVVALFSERPVDVSAIESSISLLDKNKGNEQNNLTPLPDAEYGTQTIQYSVIVDIEESS
jgi:hypothetical protein